MVPFNYLFLFTFALSISYLLVRLVEKMKNKDEDGVQMDNTEDVSLVVVQAIAMTVGMVIGLSSFALIHQRTFDLTEFTPYIYVIVFATGVMSIIMMAVNSMTADDENAPKMDLDIKFMYNLIGVIIFSIFLMYDIQLIVGGQAAFYKFDLESYCLGALALYIDVVNIFAILLNLFAQDWLSKV